MAHNPDIYAKAGIYDASLPPYRFGADNDHLVDDEEILRETVEGLFGKPAHQLDILEIGAGTGRMSQVLSPFARNLTVSDKYSGVLEDLRSKLPEATVIQSDTRELPTHLPMEQQFGLVGAYWTLSYPIGDCLETIEDNKIIPVPDLDEGVREASEMIGRLVNYIRPDGGVFNAYFFDSESAEQQVVTKIWEQFGPDPGGRRSFTREIAAAALESAAGTHGYPFEQRHHTGKAPFRSKQDMIAWFALCHAKGKPALVNTRVFEEETARLAEEYANADGTVDLPVGMYEFTIRAS